MQSQIQKTGVCVRVCVCVCGGGREKEEYLLG